MIKNENILQELLEISPAVAAISNRNVYNVPAGYFDALADEVIAGVQLASRPVESVPFAAPVGYFDGLAAAVMQKIRFEELESVREVFKELEEIAPLLNTIGKKTTFSVPDGYFESLATNIVQKSGEADIEEMEPGVFEDLEEMAPLLSSIGKKNPFNIPAGYFEGLADDFMQTNKNAALTNVNSEVFEELEQIAPLLNSLNKNVTYKVPEGYFEQFSVNIPAETQQAKVVEMHRSKAKWFVWLAAACVTAVIATGGLLYFRDNGAKDASSNFTKNLAKVSNDEINEYLNNTPTPGIETIPASVIDDQTPQVEPVIRSLGTDEIKDYLDKNTDPGEKSLKDI